jgi:hypothetical protein
VAIGRSRNKPRSPGTETMKGTPLYRSLHPKCANPVCPTAFHWTAGGKFFRFRPDPVSTSENDSTDASSIGIHGVRHYWLCESCSHVFTLVYEERYGVVLKGLWSELAAGETHNDVTVFGASSRKNRCGGPHQ